MYNINNSSKFYANTKRYGDTFEKVVCNLLSMQNIPYWSEIRVPSELTKNGTTEIDILFTDGKSIYVVECKNVAQICGNYNDNYWKFKGGHSLEPYSHLSPILQNNIHKIAIQSYYFKRWNEFPKVVGLIIVPDDIEVQGDIKSELFTVSSLANGISKINIDRNSKLCIRLLNLIEDGECYNG